MLASVQFAAKLQGSTVDMAAFGQMYRVHESVLMQSAYFQPMLSGRWNPSELQLPDAVERPAFEALLHRLYVGAFDAAAVSQVPIATQIALLARFWLLDDVVDEALDMLTKGICAADLEIIERFAADQDFPHLKARCVDLRRTGVQSAENVKQHILRAMKSWSTPEEDLCEAMLRQLPKQTCAEVLLSILRESDLFVVTDDRRIPLMSGGLRAGYLNRGCAWLLKAVKEHGVAPDAAIATLVSRISGSTGFNRESFGYTGRDEPKRYAMCSYYDALWLTSQDKVEIVLSEWLSLVAQQLRDGETSDKLAGALKAIPKAMLPPCPPRIGKALASLLRTAPLATTPALCQAIRKMDWYGELPEEVVDALKEVSTSL